MEYREDITNFIRERYTDEHFKNDDYKVYEQDEILYMGIFDDDKSDEKEITHYREYSLLSCLLFDEENGWKEGSELKKEIEEKFNVEFADKDCDIICKCGEFDSFSAFCDDYHINLECNSCGNVFSVN